MTDLKTDQEKAEDLKRWWKENGTSVLTGVAIAIASVVGWQQWQAHKLAQIEEASSLFATQQEKANPEALEQLKSDASSSPYASLAALSAAKNAVQSGNEDQAKTELQWTIDNSSDELVTQVAKLNLIRLEISTKNYDAAKSLMDQSFSSAYSSIIEELKGDLFFAQNKLNDAATAYQQAIQLSDGNPPRYLQMKLDSLGSQDSKKTGEGA